MPEPINLAQLQTAALAALAEVSDSAALEQWRVAVLGRRAPLADSLGAMGQLPAEERRAFGEAANAAKRALEEAFAAKIEEVSQSEQAAAFAQGRLDITLPGRVPAVGGLHPTTQLIREVSGIFARLGFQTVTGPEVEWDYYNFEALNIPRGHPARDAHDTFWITPESAERAVLLRTHTSPMQVRIMERRKPPVRVVVPGRVFRYEATDATHESTFFQFEGLCVDEGITMADLKGTLQAFVQQLFGGERKIRFRCDFFPFVEPGVDVSVDCFACDGKGCGICKGSGWIEVMGAGMVHPQVLSGVGIDPARYTGFAFGAGIERLLMLRHKINDIRLFHSNDLRFLRQFA